jgi:V/A-type H+-transporting ATPase subunit D
MLLIQIKPTRGEFLRVKKRIVFARRGHELLKKKQDALVIEFFKLLKEIKAHEERLFSQYKRASRMMDEARALESDLTIKAAAIAVQQTVPVELRIKNVAGVKLPVIERVETAHETPVFDSLMLQDVGEAYLTIVEEVLALAAKETALRKLLVEIKKVKRRARALEEILIPQLVAAKSRIQLELEEREREQFSRLKKTKHR